MKKLLLKIFNSKLDDTEEQINDMENGICSTQFEHQKKKRLEKNEISLRNFWDSRKHTNSHIIGILERKERERGRNI